MMAMPFLQTSASSIVIWGKMNLPPMVEMISSTSFPFAASRHRETASISCALPSTISRFGVVSGGKIAVSLDGTRQRAMHRCPAARVCLSAERPTPVLAPRKATVLEFVVIVLVVWLCFGDARLELLSKMLCMTLESRVAEASYCWIYKIC